MDVTLARFWDHDRLPPLDRFDPSDDAQFHAAGRHLLQLCWARHQVEAFAAFCLLARERLDALARAALGADASSASRLALVDVVLGELFSVDAEHPPVLLHLPAYLEARVRVLAGPTDARRAPRLAAVE